MKLPPSKADIRLKLQQQMEEFLGDGGEVNDIPRGLSGHETAKGPLPQNQFIAGERSEAAPEDQLPLNNIVQAIEERRRVKPEKPKTSQHKPRPRKKMIYDDFGEPLRWQWVEE